MTESKNDPNEISIDPVDRLKQAIRFVRSVSAMHNMAMGFSSGKDSCLLDYVCREAGIKVQRFHNVTTIDPEYTIPFAVKHECDIVRCKYSFLDLVEQKGFPTQFRRFCCKVLKERFYANYVFFGIRRDESVKRKTCYSDYDDMYYYSKNVYTNRFFPLLEFTGTDVEYIINERQIECHPLYYDHHGKFCVERRLGCIGCPLQGDRGKSHYLKYPILLKQVLRRGILFHQRQGRTADDAALNLVYNLFYSNHGYEKFCQTYKGLFDTDPWAILDSYFFLRKDDVLSKLPKPKF